MGPPYVFNVSLTEPDEGHEVLGFNDPGNWASNYPLDPITKPLSLMLICVVKAGCASPGRPFLNSYGPKP